MVHADRWLLSEAQVKCEQARHRVKAAHNDGHAPQTTNALREAEALIQRAEAILDGLATASR